MSWVALKCAVTRLSHYLCYPWIAFSPAMLSYPLRPRLPWDTLAIHGVLLLVLLSAVIFVGGFESGGGSFLGVQVRVRAWVSGSSPGLDIYLHCPLPSLPPLPFLPPFPPSFTYLFTYLVPDVVCLFRVLFIW